MKEGGPKDMEVLGVGVGMNVRDNAAMHGVGEIAKVVSG